MKNATTKYGALEVSTPSDREISLTRVFDAPRTMVFDAHTKPELVKRWLGARAGWTMPVCEIDLRVGGAYRYLWRGPQGDMGMRGVFREIVRPERIVATEVFDESWYPGDAIDTTVLVEKGGKTTLTLTVLYNSKEARDGVLKSPMASGVSESYDKLAELLASTPAGAAR
jgi:uncharacterized protein YndB with AHSA1/START domain